MDSSKIIRDRWTDAISGSHKPLQGDKQLGKVDMGIYPPPQHRFFKIKIIRQNYIKN
jgi:hypothetical protein